MSLQYFSFKVSGYHSVLQQHLQETVKVQETVWGKETGKLHETVMVQETAKVQEKCDVQETCMVQETVKVQETCKVQEAGNVQEIGNVQETPSPSHRRHQGVRLVTRDGREVVVDRLLLVICSPFLKDLLQDWHEDVIILADVAMEELVKDLFEVLKKVAQKESGDEQVLVMEKVVDHSESTNVEFPVNCINQKNYPTMSKLLYDHEKVQEPEKMIPSNEEYKVGQIKRLKKTKKPKFGPGVKIRGNGFCEKCNKRWNNASKPFECTCGHELGGKWVPRQKGKYYVDCPHCKLTVRSRDVLRTHVNKIHLEIKFWCDGCDFQTGSKQTLKNHISALHDKKVMNCPQCDYTSKYQHSIKGHIKKVHEGVRYICVSFVVTRQKRSHCTVGKSL